MGFESIKFFNFRNLNNEEIFLKNPKIFLIGKNGKGKTNFIESIYLACFGSSFRTREDKRMIKSNTDVAYIKAINTNQEGFIRDISIKISKREKKEIRVDSILITDRKEMLNNIPCIIFAYNDMEYITGSPEKKRWFFNQTISLTDYLFIDLLRVYKKTLKERNFILKEKKYKLLDIYNHKLALIGFKIQQKRKLVISDFNNTFTPVFKKITGVHGNLRLIYKPSWKEINNSDEALAVIERNVKKDKLMDVTTSGPHRDGIFFYINDNDYSILASTGQARLLALILKLAQAKYFSKITGKKPILLLDDVLLELDSTKKLSFIESLPLYEQIFFTFLPDEKFFNYVTDNTLIYLVDNGELRLWKKQV